MDSFLTKTFDHYTAGDAGLSLTQAGVTCTPFDPATKAPTDDYPISKLSLLKELYTKYPGVAQGDYLLFGGGYYAVQFVSLWDAQGGMDAFYQIFAERNVNG